MKHTPARDAELKELADRIELYLTLRFRGSFHLSDDDFRSIVAALRDVSQSARHKHDQV